MADVPLETIEQQSLAWWLRANKYLFYKSPSETYTESWKQKRKNTLEGVTKGFPDLVVVLKRWALLFIELKRQRKRLKNWELWASPSKVSDEQINWCNTLDNLENIGACICYGHKEAIEKILYYENL